MEREGAFVQSIYYGRIGSKDTEKLLEVYGKDGSFLLRDSTTVLGAYCLCIRPSFAAIKDMLAAAGGFRAHSGANKSMHSGDQRKAPFVHTYRLESCSDGWYIQDSRDRLQKFSTVESLIRFYSCITASSVGIVPLTDPLDRTRVPHNSLQGIAYMEMK